MSSVGLSDRQPSRKDFAEFYRIGLRLHLLQPHDVELWVDRALQSDEKIAWPLTELVHASNLASSARDELLGEIPGESNKFLPGYLVLSLVQRQFRKGDITLETSIRVARDLGTVGSLPATVFQAVDSLDDGLQLAQSGTYGSIEDIRRETEQFLSQFETFVALLPPINVVE